MNSFVKSLIQPILEAEVQKGIALVPGGFKPPTMGHFYLVDEVAKNPNISKVIVLIGHKNRDGVSKEESKAIWDIYKKYLPSNVEIKIADNTSPIADVSSLIKNNPDSFFYPVVGVRGEMDLGDLKRFDSMKGKYNNFQTIVIKSEEGEDRVSGTNTRAALIGGDKERFQAYLPTELSQEEKDKVWTILQKTPIDELVTQSEIDDVEKIADEWFEDYGIDVEFTHHFLERVNDSRNGKPISAEELEEIFIKAAEKYGLKLANLPDDFQAVLHDLRTDINLPFVLNYNPKSGDIDLVAKTVMRKRNFQTSNPKLPLNEVIHLTQHHFNYRPILTSLVDYMIEHGMNIQPLPKVKFITDDTKNANDFFGKTAYYNPNKNYIALYTLGRHPKDIVRSFAHEMVHHEQNLDGRIGNDIHTTDINQNDYLKELEKEAYLKGNMMMRGWSDSITKDILKESVLTEGRYDKITNTISSKIFNQWREDFNNGAKASRLEQSFPFEGEEIDIDANIEFLPDTDVLRVDGGADDQTNYIEVRFEIDPEKLPEFWEEISFNLKDLIRHEIEHLTHGEGDLSIPSKKMEDDMLIRQLIQADLLSPDQYFKLEKEVDANLQGMYLRAKKEKRPFGDVINTYLDAQDITPEQKEKILDLWRSRLPALNLPKF